MLMQGTGLSVDTQHKKTPESLNLPEHQRQIVFTREKAKAYEHIRRVGAGGYTILKASNSNVSETLFKSQKDLLINFQE